MTRAAGLAALAVIASIGAATVLLPPTGRAEPGAARETVLAEEAPVLLDRWLTDAGRVRRRFRGEVVGRRPTILSFTYSACGATCPVSDLVMGAVEDLLVQGGRRDVSLATLTLDPLMDTPERLRAHAAKVGAGPLRRFYTGHPADVFAVLDGLGVRFGRLEDHATSFLVFDAQGRLLRRLPLGAEPEVLLATADRGS